jgi:hypothetical protein
MKTGFLSNIIRLHFSRMPTLTSCSYIVDQESGKWSSAHCLFQHVRHFCIHKEESAIGPAAAGGNGCEGILRFIQIA